MDLKSGRSLSAAMIAGSSSVGADTQLDLHQGKPFQFQIFPYFSLLEAAAAVKFKLCTFFGSKPSHWRLNAQRFSVPFPRQLVSEALYGMFLLSRRSGLEIGKARQRGVGKRRVRNWRISMVPSRFLVSMLSMLGS